MESEEIINAAYLAGFEPSIDNLTIGELVEEAREYLFRSIVE